MSTDFLIYVVIIVNTLLGIWIFLHNKDAQTNRLYTLFVLFLNLWIISNFLENEPSIVDYSRLELFLRLDFVFAIYLFLYWFYFCSVFTKSTFEKNKLKWVKKAFFIISGILAALSLFTELILTNVSFYDNVIHFEDGPLWLLYALLLLLLSVGGFIILFHGKRKAKKEHDVQRSKQIDFILLGFFISIGNAVFVNLFLQTFYPISLEVSRLGLYGMTFLVSFTGYAIVKHQFLDIRVVIQRGLIYTILASLVLILYVGILNIFGFLFQQRTEFTAFASAVFTTLTAVFTIPHIEHYLRKVTDLIFFKDKYDYQEAIQKLSEILHKSIYLDDIIQTSTAQLKTILRTEDVSLELAPFKTKMKDRVIHVINNGTGLHVPIILNNAIEGVIKLGEKRSGDTYTREDIQLLTTFSYQAAIAIERGRLYQQVAEYSRSLEKKVGERTKQIEALQKAQKQMMVDISHGLQTPLTVIKGELSFLEKQMPNNKKLSVFEKSIDEVSTFIYDLLKLARLETIPARNDQKKFSLSETLDEQVEYFATVGTEKNISVEGDIQKNITIRGDHKKIEELIMNLVSNAMKYMSPKGKREIHIALKSVKQAAIITITDTGIGINKEDLPHIFSRFYRIANQKNTSVKGTGLGLAICKKIVENHNGSIHAESVMGEGTTFIIELPRI